MWVTRAGTVAQGAPQRQAAGQPLTLESVKVDKAHLNIADAWNIPDGGGTRPGARIRQGDVHVHPAADDSRDRREGQPLDPVSRRSHRTALPPAWGSSAHRQGGPHRSQRARGGRREQVAGEDRHPRPEWLVGSRDRAASRTGRRSPTPTSRAVPRTPVARRTGARRRAAINEVRVVAVTPDVQYHPEGSPDEC